VTLLDLDPDQLLSTTRAVRRRLDFDRPVPDDVIRECVAMALQAPSASNEIVMRFVVIRDRDMIAKVSAAYLRSWRNYEASPRFAGKLERPTTELREQQQRVAGSAGYLAEHMAECPVLVIGCLKRPRVDKVSVAEVASALGSILPPMWSFMLAARARGLGTAWTTLHLMFEQEVADIIGVSYADTQQVCLTPLAYTKGTDFKTTLRPDPDTVIDWR
jgi:nitroreductase